jgi:hypothetical protein
MRTAGVCSPAHASAMNLIFLVRGVRGLLRGITRTIGDADEPILIGIHDTVDLFDRREQDEYVRYDFWRGLIISLSVSFRFSGYSYLKNTTS